MAEVTDKCQRSEVATDLPAGCNKRIKQVLHAQHFKSAPAAGMKRYQHRVTNMDLSKLPLNPLKEGQSSAILPIKLK